MSTLAMKLLGRAKMVFFACTILTVSFVTQSAHLLQEEHGLVRIETHPRDDGPPDAVQELQENALKRTPPEDYNNFGGPLPGKKGLGSTTENIRMLELLSVYWNYSWKPNRDDAQPADVEFLPMIWGFWDADYLKTELETVVRPQFEAGTAKRLLLINEPDIPNIHTSANVPPATVFEEVWPQIDSAEKNWPLSSPNVANPKGDWMVDFMSRANENDSRIDFIAFHCYPPPGDTFENFKRHIIDVYNFHGGKRPLLLTELACPHWTISEIEENEWSPAEVLAFAKKALPWLEAQDFVLGYAWFPFPIDLRRDGARHCSIWKESSPRWGNTMHPSLLKIRVAIRLLK